MLVSPIPDIILCEVLRIRPEHLATKKAKVRAEVERFASNKQQGHREPEVHRSAVGGAMDIPRALAIIDCLAEGLDPVTKEAFPSDSPYHQPCVIRALYTVARELRRTPQQAVGSATGKPANAWKPWTPDEDDHLRAEFAARMAFAEVARRHGRTRVAILGRLYRLGLFNAAEGLTAVVGEHLPESQAAERGKQSCRAGSPWTAEEDGQLLEWFDAGVPLQQLAKRLQRGERGVEVRLCKLGRDAEGCRKQAEQAASADPPRD
jgi:hypothetical protein